MNITMDQFGADDYTRPLTISFTDDTCPLKQSKISSLLSRSAKHKKTPFSIYNITQRDYFHPSYMPTRSPPTLQLQIHSSQNKNRVHSKSYNQKCKTLPINEQHYDEIYKRIEIKQKMLEQLYPTKTRSITQSSNKSDQHKAIQTENNISMIHKKNQEIQTLQTTIQSYRPPQSRVSSSYQNNHKLSLLKPTALTLGLSIEKCKIVGRLTTQYFTKTPKTTQAKSQNHTSIVNQPKIQQQQQIIRKKSIPLTKWEYSDLEND